MSKKVISLALAVIMVISVFAVTAFASTPASGCIGIKVISDAEVGMAAGSTVTVGVQFNLPAGVSRDDYRHGWSNFAIGYNSEFFSFNSGSLTIGDAFSAFTLVSAEQDKAAAPVKAFTDADKAKYDTAVQCGTKQDGTQTTYTAKTGFAIPEGEDYITLTFTVKKELTADAAIGVVEGSIAKQTVVKYHENGKTTLTAYAAANYDLSEAVSFAKAGYKVFDGAVKIRKNAADNTKYDLGFTGSFEDFDPKFDENGTSASIKSVGCEVTINGVTNTYTDRYVYEGTTYGKYAFRVAVGAFGPLDTTEVSIRMFVELNEAVDGQTKFYSEGITTTMNEQIQARDS